MDVDDYQRKVIPWDRVLPWGTLFGSRSNFEWGYFVTEGRLVKKYFRNNANLSVLVIGSGNGREARPICHHNCQIVCIDIGNLYLNAGKKLFTSEMVQNVSFVQADAKYMPFADGSFDFVFFSLYSYLGKNRFDVLRDIHRISRNDGLVLMTNVTSLYRVKEWFIISNKEQLCQEALSCGFELIDYEIDPIRPEYCCSILKYI